MKYLSLFTGIGGFELGIQQAYVAISNTEREEQRRLEESQPNAVLDWYRTTTQPICVGYSEIDKYAIQIYQKHFNHKNYGDITKINADELPDFDLLVGGFPCQSFSIAGKRKGFDDVRGTMFFHIARILKSKHPPLFLLENVKGLLSHDIGQTFFTIISTLDELGYDLQWQVLNSKNFGVPQNRERVFIVGHIRGTTRPKVFPITDSNGKNIIQINQPRHSNDRVYSPKGISPTLNTMQGGRRQPFVCNPKMLNYKADYENSVAITATAYKEPPVINAIRRLTPLECERLQGFPDGWTKGVSDTQRYKCLGNAVTVNVIQAIMERLLTPSLPREEIIDEV